MEGRKGTGEHTQSSEARVLAWPSTRGASHSLGLGKRDVGSRTVDRAAIPSRRAGHTGLIQLELVNVTPDR